MLEHASGGQVFWGGIDVLEWLEDADEDDDEEEDDESDYLVD